MLLIKNVHIHDAVHEEGYDAEILVDHGKISMIGSDLPVDTACEVFDGEGRDIYPGFIDPHTHIGMFGYAGAGTKDDVEEYERITPANRGIDCINPNEDTFDAAVRGGVTCICDGPGSVNPIAGTHCCLKTYGRRIDDMIVKNPCAMKIAFGQNAKAFLRDKLTTRMTIAREIRDTLYRAKDYMERKEAARGDSLKMPLWNADYEALIPVLKKQIPLKAHTHRADDVFTALRIARELDVNITLEHVSDSGEIIDELAEAGVPIAYGPFIAQNQKEENARKKLSDAVRLIRAGCNVSVMTDSPIVAEEYLPVLAGMLMREGATEFEALQSITINAARHIGVEDRVGSIEVGKDADFVLAYGCPMEVSVKPEIVYIDGKRVFG